jgi:hypothetical protein
LNLLSEVRSIMMSDVALGVGLACATFLTGLIWFVQVVHYPLFAAVGAGAFPEYHRAHTRRTTLIVAGPMLAEALASATMVLAPPVHVGRGLPLISLALVTAIWVSTAMVQVPLHRRLSQVGLDPATIDRLARSNAARVLLWTLHVGTLALVLRARLAP